MRKSRLLLSLSATAITVALFVFTAACHKKADDSLTNADDNGGYASDNVKMEQNSNDVVSMADVAAATNSGSGLRTTGTTLGGCATVTRSVTGGGDSLLTITFTAGCTCADGKIRSGSIVVQYSGRYKDSGSTHTITYDNYFVNGNQLSGIKTVTNMGTNSSGQVYYTVNVNDTLNLGTGNGEVVWSGTRTRTWLTGYSTSDRTDDSYLISGTTTLTRANGNKFVMQITTPLQIAYNCAWIEAGVVSVTGPLGGVRTLNYGNGNCDSEAELTIGSHTYNITLK